MPYPHHLRVRPYSIQTECLKIKAERLFSIQLKNNGFMIANSSKQEMYSDMFLNSWGIQSCWNSLFDCLQFTGIIVVHTKLCISSQNSHLTKFFFKDGHWSLENNVCPGQANVIIITQLIAIVDELLKTDHHVIS